MKNRHTRGIAASLAVAVLAAAGLVGGIAPAMAASVDVFTTADLESAISVANSNSDADTIVIAADITGADLILDVTAPLIIEMNGFAVSNVRLRSTADLTLTGPGRWATGGRSVDPNRGMAPGLGIGPDATLTIDGLTVQAYGAMCDAAIGGWNLATSGCNTARGFGGGTIIIRDSDVTAASTSSTAIGSNFGDLSDISIIRSSVNAHAESGGAAIGGRGTEYESSYPGSTGAITISDSTVTARTDDREAAAIGASRYGTTGAIHISGSTISTRDSGGGSGIGSGVDPIGTPGTLTLDSSVIDVSTISAPTTIPADTTVTVPSNVWSYFRYGLTNNGTIQIDGTGRLDAGQTIVNNGAILPAANVTATDVTVNDFTVVFDENPASPWGISLERIYADTMSDVARTVRAPYDPPPGQVFTEWNTASDGTGDVFTATSSLAPLTSADGVVTVYAQWIDDYVDVAPSSTTLVAGSSQIFISTAPVSGGGAADVSATAILTSSEKSDVVTSDEIAFTKAGTRTITSTYKGMTSLSTVEVTADVQAGVAITPSASTVVQGGSVTLAVDGIDRFGNVITVEPSEVTLTSNVKTDEIDGLTVRFPHASPHTITATMGAFSASITIEVSARATSGGGAGGNPLAETGGPDAAPAVLVGGLLLMLGAGAFLLTRRRVLQG